MERVIQDMQRMGEPWGFGIDPDEVGEYLTARGLDLIDHVGATDHQTRYPEPIGRQMDVFEAERIILAQVAEA